MSHEASVREVEAKFRVGAAFELPPLTGERTGVAVVEGPSVATLTAVYWDSTDLRLAREGITLRHRTGEGAADGWHLKLPVHEAGIPDASTGARDELHDTGPDDVVPARLRELVEVHLRGAVVGPVATLVTTRASYDLCGADGEHLATLTDDLVSVLDLGHVAGRFREIEIEIEVEDAGRGVAVVAGVGAVLRSAGAVGGQFVPKVVRALGPQATAQPDPPPPTPVAPDDPARLALQAVLRRYTRAFMAQDPVVRRGGDDGVHQMRVAARRLRSALKTFRPLVDRAWADSLRAELAWVADGLGGARDGEVLLARLHGRLDELPVELVVGPARARIDAVVGGDLVQAAHAAVALLGTERYLTLVDRLVAAAWEPMTTEAAERPTGEVLPGLVDTAWRRLAKRARDLDRPEAADVDWHRTRIAAKQARYAAEAVVPFFGKPAGRLARRAEELQELLGEHQDAVITAGVLRRLATAPGAGSYAFTLGLLFAQEQQVMEWTRSEFPALWAKAARPTYRKWLTAS